MDPIPALTGSARRKRPLPDFVVIGLVLGMVACLFLAGFNYNSIQDVRSRLLVKEQALYDVQRQVSAIRDRIGSMEGRQAANGQSIGSNTRVQAEIMERLARCEKRLGMQ